MHQTITDDNRRFPSRPFIGVGAVVFDAQARVLLIERGKEPLKGHWTVPGGMVELGERVEAAVRRETLEETGLDVRPIVVAEVFEHISGADADDAAGARPEFHHVILDYWCELIGGTLQAASDVAAAGWFTRAEMAQLKMAPGTVGVVEKAWALRQARELGE